MAASRRESLLLHVYHHVVLPRDVPGQEDTKLYAVESEIARRLTDATKQLAQHAPLEDLVRLDAIRLMLSTCSTLNVDGKIDKNMLVKELHGLEDRQALVLHVTEQNVALLIYRHLGNAGSKTTVFEAFETSAPCEQVLAAENALQWDFPGQAVAVPCDVVSSDDFSQSLSAFLEQASLESIKQFAAVTYKACAPLPEIRDTADPTLITGALMTILKVNGTTQDVPLLRKRVRDTVRFDKAHKPWRRSAFYLMLRVAMQRHLYALFGIDKGRLYFKTILSMFMSTLLNDGMSVVPNEASHNLLQKLGRRLAKLELDQERGSDEVRQLHRGVFKTLRFVMEKSLSAATRRIDSQWEAHKRKTSRVIWPIPQYASNSDVTLRLPSSGQLLNRAMYYRFNTTRTEIRSATELLGQYENTPVIKPFIAVMNRYLGLCAYEKDVSETLMQHNARDDTAWCTHLARMIEAYVSTVGDAYSDYPEFKSRYILSLMELWTTMDKHAVNCYPLLRKFHPGFEAAMLDVLQLSSYDELSRLRDVQRYIFRRCQGWCGTGPKTIFSTPAEDSFAVQYYNESDDASLLADMRHEIEEEADDSLAAKEAEWQEKSESHETKIREMAGLSCIYIMELDEDGSPRRVHQKPCMKHRLKWEAKQMVIEISEYPLPKMEPALKAIIFELQCPQAFAAYRDATWNLLSSFAFPAQDQSKNVPLLRAYSGLRDYANQTKSRVTLGSSTKSHLESHYAKSGFPVVFRDICRSFGLSLDYFDEAGKTWTKIPEHLSFAHLFPMKLPLKSPYQYFEDLNDNWPTSNRVLAAQTKCPTDVNIHEYIAWQGLLIGTYLRWPSLLRELGSTNLSFSTDSTWAIVSRLVLQAGPATSEDVLRDTHSVFHDITFCRKLLEQINYRLDSIRRNWREPVQLDILISMLLRLQALGSNFRLRSAAVESLVSARTITQGWCESLRSAEQEYGSGPSIFAIWAAVLCKRTFYTTIHDSEDLPLHVLVEFVVASITLQNCLVGQFNTLPYNLRNAVLRDLLSSYNVRERMESSLRRENNALLEALEVFWPVATDCMKYSITVGLEPSTWWIAMTFSSDTAWQHHVHFNYVQGTLLIDGQQLGILPPEYRRWPIVEELFGPQGLGVFPSRLPGMSVMINRVMPYNHRVHLGFRDKNIVIRAEHRGTILELLSPNCFGNQHRYDLPAGLAIDCYHWLDLTTGIIEIRQQDPWKSKGGNWRLDLTTRQATRRNGSTLVDPNSELAQKIVQNFHHFELAHFITVYQPAKGRLRVELKRLELDFVVTYDGLLLCPQLDAVIAESRFQDVGTWHGLKSKLVVRSLKDSMQRSILLPLGEAECERDGPHVSIVIRNVGEYLKFEVNHVLGRIDCPAEPVLMYQRALWHACTAYFLSDSLTKRTGVEEALQYLRSGAYYPWTPLSTSAYSILLMLAKLSPPRVYYPTSLKAMEAVHWNPEHTVTIQDDRYRRAVESILNRNTDLVRFASTAVSYEPLQHVAGDVHLENRALCHSNAKRIARDHTYQSRDGHLDDHKRQNVAVVARMLSDWPSRIPNTTQLAKLLEKVPIISGYVRSFDKIQITDLLNVDLGFEWGALVKTALGLSRQQRFQLTFLYSLLAFSSESDMDMLRAILSFALLPELKSIALPEAASYSHFRTHEIPCVSTLMSSIAGAKRAYTITDATPSGQILMRQMDHDREVEKACKIFADSVRAQWPSKPLDADLVASVKDHLIDREEAFRLIHLVWDGLVDNFQFFQHLEHVQLIFLHHAANKQSTDIVPISYNLEQPRLYPVRMRGGDLPSLPDILGKDVAMSGTLPASLPNFATGVLTALPNGSSQALSPLIEPGSIGGSTELRKMAVPQNIKELNKLIFPYKSSISMVHKRYGAELEHSVTALFRYLAKPDVPKEPFNPIKLKNDLFAAKQCLQSMLEQIHNALLEGDARAKWLDMVGLWPRLTAAALLTELRSTSGACLGSGVKETLVVLGLAVTRYQRLIRLNEAIQKDRQQQILDEGEHMGHINWNPLKHVDWLLLEVESNIMIRPEQVDVALATISPANNQNSVVQLLMGKGKTSCILPMVALELASKSLFRIVVPRPLLLQSAQIMQARLGGLLDREVVHVPFSRKTPTDKTQLQTYCLLHNHIQKQSGVVLALPEHILSFKLSGLQRLCDGKIVEAAMMIKTQAWLDRHARDVLDECDVSLAIRTQLIYPSGSQQTVDGHPHRWQTIQALLDLVISYLDDLVWKYPNSIEVVCRSGFPLIYFLRKDAEQYLINQIVQKICKGQTAILPIRDFDTSCQADIHDFISLPLIDAKVTDRVVEKYKESPQLINVVYHLRGLFVHRILLSTLKKRWNVQYGLHPTRDPIAVPYQAKGVPSPAAEWGHPDVAIILTCLSFYYEGLNMSQFKQAIEHLAKSDEPNIEYSLWVADGIPEAFRNYNAVNVEDSQQLRELYHYVRYKVRLLDYYLNCFVFPRHAKQFSKKLTASGSDLILYEPLNPSCQTTGFSGTNDTRHQLPMTIKQNDLPQLAHTNAEVLAYLLEHRNRRYVRMVDMYHKRLSEQGMLKKLVYPYGYQSNFRDRIRILIDAGAQILEYDNRSLVKAWLKEDHEAVAAVYFDEDHRARVMYGKHTDIPLVASPFAENLEGCLVYIDESHCRGIDLKLPPYARAALTLGPHLTKDALVQAAMRLRLLGKTQSVTFFSPPEVHQSILDLRAAAKASPYAELSSFDVLRWLLDQSCNAIEQLEPLYFSQSSSYLQRTQAKFENPEFLENEDRRKKYLDIVRSQEMQSLKQLYEPKHHQRGSPLKSSAFAPCLRKYISELIQRRKGFQDGGHAIHASAVEEVEQEREMEFEVESVREVQPPVHFKALKVARLHPNLEEFATAGRMLPTSDAYQPMFCAMQKTALGAKQETFMAKGKTARLYVSTQFMRTVSVKEANDNFLRPCQWIMWSAESEIGLLVSPEEANALIPILRQTYHNEGRCHLITYSAPTTRQMLQFNDLDYYAIPALAANFRAPMWLKVELGIFAGRLYFGWGEYEAIMSYLGAQIFKDEDDQLMQPEPNEPFTEKPLSFLHDWLATRRKGQDFEHTPMGFITTGKPLSANHPFFSIVGRDEGGNAKLRTARVTLPEEDESDDNESDDGEDHAKEHLFRVDDGDDGHEVFHDAEQGPSEESTFFNGGAYVGNEKESDGESEEAWE